jgi:hypothetical protein
MSVAALDALIDHQRIHLSATRVGESIGRMNSPRRRAAHYPRRECIAQLARDAFGAERLCPGHAGWVEYERDRQRAVSCAVPRSEPGSASARRSSASMIASTCQGSWRPGAQRLLALGSVPPAP